LYLETREGATSPVSLAGMELPEEYIQLFLKDYARFREGQLASYMILPAVAYNNMPKEDTLRALSIKLQKSGKFINTILESYMRYIDHKKKIAQTYQESEDWHTVFSTDVYMDDYSASEGFIDYLEETYKTTIRDVAHLQELTGITELDTYKNGKYVEPDTEEEAKQNAIDQLTETLLLARESKFYRALEIALQNGAKYKDLLEIKPQAYGLLETWESYRAKDQYNAIVQVIGKEYLLHSPGGLMLLPSLRAVANDLEAPYSVVMDAYTEATQIRRM
jgi:hypothetical protein